MRAVYRVLGQLIAVAVVLQVASIALSGFTIAKDADDGTSIGADYSNFGQAYHSIAGMVIALLALVFLIVSFLTVVSFGVPALGVLHGINGLVIAGVASAAARRAVVPKQTVASA